MYKNNFIANDVKTNNILLVAGDNFIKTMTRGNNTKDNVMQLKEIYSESNLISKLEQNTSKSIETNGSFDLDPKGSKKIELRKIYQKYRFITNSYAGDLFLFEIKKNI